MSHKRAQIDIAVHFLSQPCRWIREGTLDEGIRFVMSEEIKSADRPVWDAWKVRSLFMTLKSEKEFLRFLNKTGRFTSNTPTEAWGLQDLYVWQELMRRIAGTPPERWVKLVHDEFSHAPARKLVSKFESRFDVQFGKLGKFYVGRISVETTLRAMVASTYIDWMAGVKTGFCARQDCRRPFEIASRHRRIYCGHKCGHYETVRRSRDRVKAQKKAGKAEVRL